MSKNFASGNLEKLLIYSFTKKDFSTNVGESTKPAFVAPINPESFTKNFKVERDGQPAAGNSGQELKFKYIGPKELKLDFILDGTGTMEGYWDAYKKMSVHDQLELFTNTVYNYNGNIHQPNFLLIIWGSEIKYRCVLTNLDINFTLFHPDGTPLRAKLSATFLDYMAKEERLAKEKRRSPDLTHFRKITQADRLDLLTNSIYNNPKYLAQVARVNGLTTLRVLKPGNELKFPPFNKTEA